MNIIVNDVGSFICDRILDLLNTFFDLWKFLSDPFIKIDLTFLENWDFILNKLTLLEDLSFLYQVHYINLFFFLTTTGIIILVIFKLIDLIIPV